jgi:hypothetical protein
MGLFRLSHAQTKFPKVAPGSGIGQRLPCNTCNLLPDLTTAEATLLQTLRPSLPVTFDLIWVYFELTCWFSTQSITVELKNQKKEEHHVNRSKKNCHFEKADHCVSDPERETDRKIAKAFQNFTKLLVYYVHHFPKLVNIIQILSSGTIITSN